MSLHLLRLALILQYLRIELNVMHLQYHSDTTNFLLRVSECRRIVVSIFIDFNNRSGSNVLTNF